MKNIVHFVAIGMFALLITSCSKSDNGYSNNSNTNNNNTTTTTGNAVSIPGMSFSPGTITVKAGTTITWTNNDYTAHTVTADDNSFNSGNLNAGQTFQRTFSTVGTFPYHCQYHSGMKGTVVVN